MKRPASVLKQPAAKKTKTGVAVAMKPAGAKALRPADIIMGCVWLAPGHGNEDIGQEAANVTVATAAAAGIKEFDSAPWYGYGASEERIGRAVAALNLEHKVYLMTKAGRLCKYDCGAECIDSFQDEGARPLSDRRMKNDYTAAGARASLQQSLERMKVKKIHKLRVHDPNDNSTSDKHVDEVAIALAEDGIIEELVKMRKEKVVDKIGIGMNCNRSPGFGVPDEVIRIVSSVPKGTLDSAMLAGGWNLLCQDGWECLAECEKKGVHVHVAGVYASGLLVGVDRYAYSKAPQEMKDKAKKWGELAAKHGCELPAVAIAFAYLPKVVTRIVLGMATKEEVLQNMRSVEASAKVPRKIWKEASELGLVDPRVTLP